MTNTLVTCTAETPKPKVLHVNQKGSSPLIPWMRKTVSFLAAVFMKKISKTKANNLLLAICVRSSIIRLWRVCVSVTHGVTWKISLYKCAKNCEWVTRALRLQHFFPIDLGMQLYERSISDLYSRISYDWQFQLMLYEDWRRISEKSSNW